MLKTTCPVIAIAAPIGGGKSTLSAGLAHALDNAACLHFDDYEQASRHTPAQLRAWLDRGGDLAEFSSAELLRDLSRLKRGQAIRHPQTGAVTEPKRCIVLEMPLGRADPGMVGLIDLLLWLDVPADVALARHLQSICATRKGEPRQTLDWVSQYLANYLDVVRHVLARQREVVRAGADAVLDGEAEAVALLQQALAEVRKRLPL